MSNPKIWYLLYSLFLNHGLLIYPNYLNY